MTRTPTRTTVDDDVQELFDEVDSLSQKKRYLRNRLFFPNTEEKRRARAREEEDAEVRAAFDLKSPESPQAPQSNDTLFISSSSLEEYTSLCGEKILKERDDAKRNLVSPSSSPSSVSSALTSYRHRRSLLVLQLIVVPHR
jgi:hypothetical protein